MSSPDITNDDVKAVAEVVRSGRLCLGSKAIEFGRRLAAISGVKHGIPVSSGTAALHLIVRALGLTRGDEVLVPSFTFAASVNVLLYEGLRPVFVDIEPDTFNLDPADLERRAGKCTRAVMVVDAFGHPAEWAAITATADRYDWKLIGDSCEALGAEFNGKPLGSFGSASAFAFYPNKQITTGEGGALVTDDDEIARLGRSLSNQGRGEMGAWVEHERLGYNYRMDEMSAALGLSQVSRLDQMLAKRSRVANMYNERLSELTWLTTPIVRPHVKISWFVYVIKLGEGLHRGPFMEALEAEGVPVRGYFCPIHKMPYVHEIVGATVHDLPVTESVAQRTIALPFHGNLSEDDVDFVVDRLRAVGARLA